MVTLSWTWSIGVNAQTYYFSEQGSDANSGISQAAPWATLGKLIQVYPNGVPSNVNLRLRRGDAFEGQINIAANASNISIQGYGTGDRSIIYGSRLTAASEWTDPDADGTWQWNLPVGWPENTPDQSYPEEEDYAYLFDGTGLQPNDPWPMPDVARYPNTGWLRNAQYTPGPPATLVPDAPLPAPASQFDQSHMVLRSSYFRYRVREVGVANGALQFAAWTGDNLGTEGWGFFFMNRPNLIDLAGEWCFRKPAAGGFFQYKTADGLAPANVRLSEHLYGVNVGPGANRITIDGIEFRHQRWSAVRARGGVNGLTVNACVFRDLSLAIEDKNGDFSRVPTRTSLLAILWRTAPMAASSAG